MSNFFRKYPFSCIGILLLSTYLIAAVLIQFANLQYDDGGIGGVVYLVGYITGLPFLIAKLRFAENQASFLMLSISILSGFLFFFAADLILSWFRYVKRKGIF